MKKRYLSTSDLSGGEILNWLDNTYEAIEIDIGCGTGKFLSRMAQRYPKRLFIGVEIQKEHALKAARLMDRIGLSNVRIVNSEGYQFIRNTPETRISTIHSYFPTPHPSALFFSGPLISPNFLSDLHRVLVPGGTLRMLTDIEEYASEVRNHIEVDKWQLVAWHPLDLELGEGYLVDTPAEIHYSQALGTPAEIHYDQAHGTSVSTLQANKRDTDHFVITVSEDKIVFRPVFTLSGNVRETKSGQLVPSSALLTGFKDTFGGFTPDEIEELEELINNPSTKERDIQVFLENHTHFFNKWDHKEVHSHVRLTRKIEGPLIPDFLLIDHELQKATLIDLKLPPRKIVRRQKNRDRFAASVSEARAQLLQYRDWFDIPENRKQLKKLVGMEVYKPHLVVIVGRSSEFRDALDRQHLTDYYRDLEIITYDDLLTSARRRTMFLKWDV